MTKNRLDLVDLVDGFVRLVDSSFPDIGFTGSEGEIELTEPIAAVTVLRLELPTTEFLHLASVLIEADGLDDPVAQTTRTMSSAWKDYEQILEQGRIFDPENSDKGFHTRKETLPWMEISFDQPRDVSRVRLVNCAGPNSVRGRGIAVGVRTADGRYRTVYDGAAREREFIHAAEDYANRYPESAKNPESPQSPGADSTTKGAHSTTKGPELVEGLISRARSMVGALRGPSTSSGRSGAGSGPLGAASSDVDPLVPKLVKIMTMIALQDDTAVRWALERSGGSPDQVRQFRTEVNRRLLFARERELTSHGVRRSFRFWTPQQQQSYLGFALDVVEALRELTPNVCFGFGSALAIVRDQELIPHDDDLDVLIGFEPEQAGTHTEGRQLIRDCLTAKGFKITGGMTAYQWVTRSTGGTRLDVFIGVFEADDISWYPGKRGALTRDMMFPPVEREFLGRQCPVPTRAEAYLEQIYGPGWVHPDPGFKHTWDPTQYADIAGG